MAYAPELNYQYSCTLRRIAWAANKPMTHSIEDVIDFSVRALDPQRVCEACKDRTRCADCLFWYPSRKLKEKHHAE